VQRTFRLKLQPTPDQERILLETTRQHTECYNAVARYGWETNNKNGVELHKATYYDLRGQFPDLPAQLVIAARMRATESLASAFTLRKKTDKKRNVSCPTSTLSPIRYDVRSYRYDKTTQCVNLSTVEGRQCIPVLMYDHAQKRIDQAIGFDSADLIVKEGFFFIYLVITLPVPEAKSTNVIGVDFGETRPAVTSDNKFYGARRWKGNERRYFRRKRRLQSKGTKSAKRHLKQLSKRVARFRTDCDHVVSRRIVDSVEVGTTIVVENLTEIRTNGKRNGAIQRRQFHQWSFKRLRELLTYKAEAKGCQVVGVDPRHTSQTCSKCGCQHKSNRKSQSRFKCRSCGYQLNADLNGSRNIALKYLAIAGTSGDSGPLSIGLLSQPSASVAR
jgi:putative transposase